MRGADGQEAARSDVLMFVGCVSLALVALALPRSWALSVASGLRQTALRPIVALEARAERDRRARFALAGVEHTSDSLSILAQQQAALRRENEILRGIAGVRAGLSHPGVSAEVLHRPTVTDSRMLLLDVGAAEGVQMFDPVVTADGLIGSIVTTSAHNSSALTWANPDFAASAITSDGSVSGFVHPSTSGIGPNTILELQGIPLRDSLANGTIVMTAGSGGTYPRGIPIGRIVGIGREVNGYDRIYRVIPFAAPGEASHVIVLTSPRDSLYLKLVRPVPAK
ncbi:MAG: rod shape-determining protein MreC [Gemmatimonadota bacterium]